jgi:serine-type D-Ala-D-Ala endopeptidase (penicillin-binding protein 7)
MNDSTSKSVGEFRVIDYYEDIPNEAFGQLIPVDRYQFIPRAVVATVPVKNPQTGRRYWILVTLYLSLVLVFGLGTIRLVSDPNQLLALLPMTQSIPPAVTIVHPYRKTEQPLTYGVQLSFTEPLFFSEVRDGFIEAEQSFIEIQLAEMKLRVFQAGVLTNQFPILQKGEPGAWGEVPSGLYKVDTVANRYFSTLGQVYLPHYVNFQGTLAIHGTPSFTNGEVVPADYAGGAVRLADADAAVVAHVVQAGWPVLVHERNQVPDTFVYEPKIPDIPAQHYLIADIGNNTVLASSALDEPVPIASLTKLMTALVATEVLNLDRSVQVNTPTFVQSLIPRLQYRQTVSLYSLIQLLLIESSNEAADVIATQVGHERFVALMNERASSLGLTNTTFIDPSGLNADNVSSLRDLLRLTQHIYQTRRFLLELSANQSLPSAFVKDEFGILQNFNGLTDDTTFIGGKIGETKAAGQTSITLHQLRVKGEDRIVAIIILGSESRDSDVKQLLQFVTDRFGVE